MNRALASVCSPILLLLFTFSTPTLLFPPTALASLQIEPKWEEIPSRPGNPCLLTVSIHWTGEADRYAISTPELDLPEEISDEGISSSSFSQGEETYLIYTITLSIHKSGSFGPIPISLSVYGKNEKQPSSMVVKTEPFTVGDQRWKGTSIRYLTPAGIILLILVVIGIVWQVKVSRKRRPSLYDREETKGQELWDLMTQGRGHLIRGDSLSFLKTAHTIERSLQDKEPDTLFGLTTLIERVRYGGHRPPPEEMERMYRALKVRLQQRFPQEGRDKKEMEASSWRNDSP